MLFPVDTCVDYEGCESPAVWPRQKGFCRDQKLRPVMERANQKLGVNRNAFIATVVNFVRLEKHNNEK